MRSREHIQVVDLQFWNLFVDPLWVNKIEDAIHQLVLVVLTYVVLYVLQDVQDAFHVFLHQLRSQQPKDGYRSLVQDEDAVKEVKVPNVRHDSQWQ